MIETNGIPRSSAVAIIAVGTRGNMRERLAGLGENASRGVADLARAGSRLEVSIAVAFLAADEFVVTRERKAGLEVVEVRRPGVLCPSRSRGEARRNAEHQKCAKACRA